MESKKSTNWICTKNNPEISTLEYLQRFYETSQARYVCGQLEKGESGTPHIQFYVNFHKPAKSLKHLQKSDKSCHYEIVKVAGAAQRYCLKEDTRVEGPYELGEKPIRRNEKSDWEEIYALAKAGRIADIPGHVAIPHYRNLKAISGDCTVALEQPSDRGLWIVGSPGVGKTHYVRHTYGDRVYWKAQNKWWDGYSGEDIACIDDMDTDCLSHYLKVWSHKWPCYGEIKGGRVALNYSTLVVTSNFTIHELFAKLPEITVEAIRRRFKVLHIKDPFKIRQADQEMKDDSLLQEERPRDDAE